MKKHIAVVIGWGLGLASLLAAASAHAQVTETIHVKVPFSFVAAGKAWPAADYTVHINTSTGVVTLGAGGVGSVYMWTASKVDARSGDGRSYLKFEGFGDRWVLEEVTYHGTEQVLRRGKIERQLAQLQPTGEQTLMASNAGGR